MESQLQKNEMKNINKIKNKAYDEINHMPYLNIKWLSFTFRLTNTNFICCLSKRIIKQTSFST